MRLSFVPLAVALLPLAAIHVCYLLAAHLGHVPWCLPYVDSCTSISATGRESPESHVFRATIMPSAALMLVYWVLVHEWFKTLGNRMAVVRRTMLGLGLVASLGLIAYAAVLGEIGDGYSLQRRIGITLFYAFTVLAQLLMAIQVEAVARVRPCLKLIRTSRVLLAVSAVTILVALANLLFWAYPEQYDRIKDAFAWWVTLLVLLHPVVTFVAWKESGFQARFVVSGRSSRWTSGSPEHDPAPSLETDRRTNRFSHSDNRKSRFDADPHP